MTRTITLATLLALAGTALAGGNKNKADGLFREGRRLLAEKRYPEACAAFEKSFTLDPEIGAELNVALCFQEWGKLARAYHAYDKALQMAREQHDSRLDKIEGRKNELETLVPQLTIRLPTGADPASVAITLDDKPVPASELGKAQLVDPGPHMVEWTVGSTKKNKVVPLERGGSSDITLELPPIPKLPPPDDEHQARPAVVAVAPAPDPGRYYRYGAYASAGTGALLIGISSVLTLSARSKYNDALSKHCMNATNMCDSTGLSATHSARHEANVATALFLIGTAAVGGGVALYFLAPHAASHPGEHAMYVVPTVGPDGAGLALGGQL